MSYLVLPKRVFNKRMIEYVNFEDGSFINIIRLIKPYANGDKYAVYETTKSPFCSNGLFKSYDKAKEKFNLMIKNASLENKISEQGKTGNFYLYEDITPANL